MHACILLYIESSQ